MTVNNLLVRSRPAAQAVITCSFPSALELLVLTWAWPAGRVSCGISMIAKTL